MFHFFTILVMMIQRDIETMIQAALKNLVERTTTWHCVFIAVRKKHTTFIQFLPGPWEIQSFPANSGSVWCSTAPERTPSDAPIVHPLSSDGVRPLVGDYHFQPHCPSSEHSPLLALRLFRNLRSIAAANAAGCCRRKLYSIAGIAIWGWIQTSCFFPNVFRSEPIEYHIFGYLWGIKIYKSRLFWCN